MRRIAPLLLCLLLACTHDLTPDPKPDAKDDEPSDARLIDKAALKDQPKVKPGDFKSPANCGTKLPDGGSTTLPGKCADLKSWTCISDCAKFHRLGCFNGATLLRQVRCNAAGQCECKIGSAAPARCSVVMGSGRKGCDICKEALQQGCCRPAK